MQARCEDEDEDEGEPILVSSGSMGWWSRREEQTLASMFRASVTLKNRDAGRSSYLGIDRGM